MSTKPLAFAFLAALGIVIATKGFSKAAEQSAPVTKHSTTTPVKQSAPAPLPAPAFDAAKAFNDLGCSGCHGDDGIYRDEIKGAVGKPVDQIARWIRNAPSIKPDTEMPNFEKQIDVPNSVALAAWVMDRAAHLD